MGAQRVQKKTEKAEGQKTAIICLSKNYCSEERRNKTVLKQNTGKAIDYKQTFFSDPYTGNFKPYTVATSSTATGTTLIHQEASVQPDALTAWPTWDPWVLADIQTHNITMEL